MSRFPDRQPDLRDNRPKPRRKSRKTRPQPFSAGYVPAGHLHPAVRLIGRGGQKETLPCFCLGTDAALLPAFGSFTGSHAIRPGPGDRIFVIAGDQVLPVGA